MRGGTDAAKFAVDAGAKHIEAAITITEIEIMRIDLDLLDIMITWDQLADYQNNEPQAKTSELPMRTSNAE